MLSSGNGLLLWDGRGEVAHIHYRLHRGICLKKENETNGNGVAFPVHNFRLAPIKSAHKRCMKRTTWRYKFRQETLERSNLSSPFGNQTLNQFSYTGPIMKIVNKRLAKSPYLVPSWEGLCTKQRQRSEWLHAGNIRPSKCDKHGRTRRQHLRKRRQISMLSYWR